jgi:hypothetical protein
VASEIIAETTGSSFWADNEEIRRQEAKAKVNSLFIRMVYNLPLNYNFLTESVIIPAEVFL